MRAELTIPMDDVGGGFTHSHSQDGNYVRAKSQNSNLERVENLVWQKLSISIQKAMQDKLRYRMLSKFVWLDP
jgi:hypothetical protein